MLKELADYAEKKGLLTEPGFSPKDVRWLIVCGDDGRFLDVVELGDTDSKRNRGRTFPMCPAIPSNIMQGGGKSHFLVETTGVVVLYEGTDDAKVLKKHEYFVTLMKDASKHVPEFRAMVDCLVDASRLNAIRNRLAALKARATDKISIRTDSFFPIESDKWHDWWRVRCAEISQGNARREKGGGEMVDILSGETIEALLTHPKISGLASVEGQPSGDVLTGFDKEAFRSYGLEQSANAAMSQESAQKYTGALNHIIKNHSRRFAGALVAHWFDHAPEADDDDPFVLLEEGEEEAELDAHSRARRLLESIHRGERPDLAGNTYYAITMSGAAGRVMVRDWMEGSFEGLVANVEAWFNDLAIVRRDGGAPAARPKFLAVLGGTVRELKDLPAPFVAKMWRVAVRHESIPGDALSRALARVKVAIIDDQPANHARMGLLKAYHIRKALRGGEPMSQELEPYLNEEHPSPAYHCGRLMAVLSALQRSALGDVGAGVVQRYYAAASATPALVLGRLARTSQFHLNKIDSPGLAHWYEDKMAGIWGRLGDGPPRTLNLEGQSLFALGYYQQMADLRTKKTNKTEEN